MDEDLPEPEPAVLAILYAPGRRPSGDGVRLAAEVSDAFALSFDPGLGSDWAEVLITGLTFEVIGLAPGPAQAQPGITHRFGLTEGWAGDALEAVLIRPGAHLAGAAAMIPVVRGCVALGAALANATGAEAVVWIPARSAMATDYFATAIGAWLDGGAFPALGLTALVADGPDLTSDGLAFFTGQELSVSTGDLSQAGRIGVRMIDALVTQGPLTAPIQLTGPAGEPLLATPSHDGRGVRVTLR